MTAEQTARTDTLFITLDGNELKLSITTRAPKGGQENPPTPTQLARIRTGCIMRYTTLWRRAVSGDFGMDDFDKDLKSPIRVVAEDENETIQPSDYAPYVTIWQMGDWTKPQSPSLTIHDFDSGNDILQLDAICKESNNRIREIFAQGVKGMRLLHLSDFVQPTTDDTQTDSPTDYIEQHENPMPKRIGRNADSLPDTPAKTVIDFSQFKPYIRKTKAGLAQGLVALETGQNHNFNIQAIELNNFQYNQVPYDDKQIVIVPITGAASIQEFMKEKNGEKRVSRSFAVAVAGGSTLRVFDWYDNDKANFEWAEVAKALGTNSEGLRAFVGQSFFIPAHYITMRVEEYEGAKKYKFHGFYHNVGDTVNEKPMLVDAKDSIPF